MTQMLLLQKFILLDGSITLPMIRLLHARFRLLFVHGQRYTLKRYCVALSYHTSVAQVDC